MVFTGNLPDLPLHSHLAAAICAGLDGEIQIRGKGLPDWRLCRTALIPSGASHEVRTNGRQFGTILTEPGATNDLSESELSPDAGHIEIEPQNGARILTGLRSLQLFQSSESSSDPSRRVEAILEDLLGPARDALSRLELDARLVRVMEILLAAPAEVPGVTALAAAIDMSPSWLQHTFKAQIGVPIRRFRTWFRLKAAALFMKRGATLVEASFAAGFYDQSHFTNAFREMFGIQPGLVFQNSQNIRWYIDDEYALDDLLERGLIHLR